MHSLVHPYCCFPRVYLCVFNMSCWSAFNYEEGRAICMYRHKVTVVLGKWGWRCHLPSPVYKLSSQYWHIPAVKPCTCIWCRTCSLVYISSDAFLQLAVLAWIPFSTVHIPFSFLHATLCFHFLFPNKKICIPEDIPIFLFWFLYLSSDRIYSFSRALRSVCSLPCAALRTDTSPIPSLNFSIA